MKLTDLQIGDFIKYLGNVYIVEEISAKGWVHLIYPKIKARLILSSDYIINLLEPIPLTPEILEKNGFVNDRGIYCWRDENKQITYFSKENNRPYCTYPFVNIESGCIDVNELPIEYVHELQHALHLCGLSDLADNLKLEE